MGYYIPHSAFRIPHFRGSVSPRIHPGVGRRQRSLKTVSTVSRPRRITINNTIFFHILSAWCLQGSPRELTDYVFSSYNLSHWERGRPRPLLASARKNPWKSESSLKIPYVPGASRHCPEKVWLAGFSRLILAPGFSRWVLLDFFCFISALQRGFSLWASAISQEIRQTCVLLVQSEI